MESHCLVSQGPLRQSGEVKKAILFFVLTAVCWLLAIVMMVRFVTTLADESNSSLAVVEAPGSAFFEIEKAGTVSLWHNYHDLHGGVTVNNDPLLPSGYSFELKEMGSATVVPFIPSKMDSHYSSPNVSKSGLGAFAIASPGDYELTVTAPPGQSRIISLSEGSVLSGMGKMMALMGGAVVLGLVGAVTLILGIVFLVAKPKSPPSIPSHAS